MLNLVYKKYSIPKVGEFWIDFLLFTSGELKVTQSVKRTAYNSKATQLVVITSKLSLYKRNF